MTKWVGNELQLNADRAREEFTRLKRKLRTQNQAAQRRLSVESSIIERLAGSKLGDEAWALVNPNQESILFQEGIEETDLAWQVVVSMFKAGNPKASANAQALGDTDKSDVVEATVSSYQGIKNPVRAAWGMSPKNNLQLDRVRPILELAKQYADTNPKMALDFAASLQNETWSREVLRLVGTWTGRSAKVQEVIKVVDGSKLKPPERTAIYRGLVSGIKANPEFKPAP